MLCQRGGSLASLNSKDTFRAWASLPTLARKCGQNSRGAPDQRRSSASSARTLSESVAVIAFSAAMSGSGHETNQELLNHNNDRLSNDEREAGLFQMQFARQGGAEIPCPILKNRPYLDEAPRP